MHNEPGPYCLAQVERFLDNFRKKNNQKLTIFEYVWPQIFEIENFYEENKGQMWLFGPLLMIFSLILCFFERLLND